MHKINENNQHACWYIFPSFPCVHCDFYQLRAYFRAKMFRKCNTPHFVLCVVSSELIFKLHLYRHASSAFIIQNKKESLLEKYCARKNWVLIQNRNVCSCCPWRMEKLTVTIYRILNFFQMDYNLSFVSDMWSLLTNNIQVLVIQKQIVLLLIWTC